MSTFLVCKVGYTCSTTQTCYYSSIGLFVNLFVCHRACHCFSNISRVWMSFCRVNNSPSELTARYMAVSSAKSLTLDLTWSGRLFIYAPNSKMNKKEKKTEEEMIRQHQGMDRNAVWRFPVGSKRPGRVERYCCNVTCGASTTSGSKVKW